MKKNFKQLIILILTFIFLSLFISYIIMNYDNYQSKQVVIKTNNSINIENMEEKLSVNKIKELQNYYNNLDIKGIISIENIEKFNYPIAQSQDNDYYLNHNYYKEYDAYGSIYADYRIDLDNSKKVLIFGHSSTKKNVPFNSLENYYNEDFYKEHKYITLETETNTYRYEIFSVYIETNDFTYMNMNFVSVEDWYLHILSLQKKSLYPIDIELDINDDILIMQTCSNNSEYNEYSKKYLLIVSRRVK